VASSSPAAAAPVEDEADEPGGWARGRILKTWWRIGTAEVAEVVEGSCDEDDEADEEEAIGVGGLVEVADVGRVEGASVGGSEGVS